MCGRYTTNLDIPALERFLAGLQAEPVAEEERLNVSPTQVVAAVRQEDPAGPPILGPMVWGLIPSWAKDRSIGSKLINARGETVAEKPSFRSAFARRRCLIPATGFYEWGVPEGFSRKMPVWFHWPGEAVLAMGGLWERWTDRATGEVLTTCTIVTVGANELVKPIHERMPVLLAPEDWARWLDPGEKSPMDLVRPFPAGRMQARVVGREVNNPRNQQGDLLGEVMPEGE
ncbi:MAG: SOS response-associated peptidase [Sumerlaeia bacterium]